MLGGGGVAEEGEGRPTRSFLKIMLSDTGIWIGNRTTSSTIRD